MIKILKLTEGQFNCFQFEIVNKKLLYIRELLQLSNKIRFRIGDTSVMIKNAQPREVYKSEDNYYIVIRPINQELAFCYSIYPT